MSKHSIFDHEFTLSRALALAIGSVERLPADAELRRMRPEMIRILAMLLAPDDRAFLAGRIAHDTGHRPNLIDPELP